MRQWQILIVLFLMSVSSCRHDDTYLLLKDVESYIEERPDSALAVIDSIDSDLLNTKRLRAHHALLHAMALDKNYIDVTSDSIIAPAASYFRRHGSADEKLKALYYSGIVKKNICDYDAAMAFFVRAESYVENCRDLVAVGRLYTAKSNIYNKLFDFESALISTEKAASFYRSGNCQTKYINALNNIALLNVQLERYHAADSVLMYQKGNWNQMSDRQKSIWYAIQLSSSVDCEPQEKEILLASYLDSVADESIINWLTVAEFSISSGRYIDAGYALDRYRLYKGENITNPSYYWYRSVVEESEKNYRQALLSMKKYVTMSDNADLEIFESQVHRIEQEYKSELADISKKKKYFTILSIVIILLLLFLLIIVYLRQRYQQIQLEQEKYMRMNEILAKEVTKLKHIRKETRITPSVKRSIDERLNILNAYFASNKSVAQTDILLHRLSELMEDRKMFVESTRDSFVFSNREFILFLKSCGLSEWEIGCCCLYCIGFNGNEIADYLNDKSFYNKSLLIRKKLNVPQRQNINKFLYNKLMEYRQ